MEAIIAVAVVVIAALIVRRVIAGEPSFGDAIPAVKLLRSVETGRLYALVEVDNANDSPASVSVRTRAATPLSVLWPSSRVIRSIDRGAFEPLGAVDGRKAGVWRVPVDEEPLGASRVTVLIDQVGGRSRAVSVTLPMSEAVWVAVTKTEAVRLVAA